MHRRREELFDAMEALSSQPTNPSNMALMSAAPKPYPRIQWRRLCAQTANGQLFPNSNEVFLAKPNAATAPVAPNGGTTSGHDTDEAMAEIVPLRRDRGNDWWG